MINNFFVSLFPCITVKIFDFCLVFLSHSLVLPFFDLYLILDIWTCQFFRQVAILRSVPDCALLEIRLPDWLIYSLTCKSSMFDHHLIEVLLEVGNSRTSSETDVRFFLFWTVKNEFCTVQLNYISNLIVRALIHKTWNNWTVPGLFWTVRFFRIVGIKLE